MRNMSGGGYGNDEAGVMDFGGGDVKKPLGGRRKKALQQQQKKMKAGAFETMGLSPEVMRAIKRKGYRLPTPIQRKSMPLIMQGLDVVGMARTGSGKTAAFVAPMIHRLKAHSLKAGARAVILSPTRELCLQTHKSVRELAKYTDLRTSCLVGGDAMEVQFEELAANPDIIVATPGRLLHHLAEVDGLGLRTVEYCVMDEADRLFEMGFMDQVKELLARMPAGRQVLLFSATLPKSLADFAAVGLQAPQLVRLDAERRISPELGLAFFTCRFEDKTAALLHLVREVVPAAQLTILFTSTRHHAEFLYQLLLKEGVQAACVFGNMDQAARKIQVAKFRAGRVHLLVTTDVAARGIDIPMIDHVINYDFPPKAELFVHRVGRAARMGRPGTAYSLLTRDELPYLLDLHLFLSRPVKPAPTVPEVPPPGSDRGDPRSDPSAAIVPPSDESLYGAVPAMVLGPLVEHVREVIDGCADLETMQTTLANAWGMYCRTRPPPSSQSVKRAKALAAEGAHPLLLRLLPRTKYTAVESEAALAVFTQRLKSFRPSATVFEAEIARVRSTIANPLALEGYSAGLAARGDKSNEVMGRKRAAHSAVIERERQKRLRLEAERQRQQDDTADRDDDDGVDGDGPSGSGSDDDDGDDGDGEGFSDEDGISDDDAAGLQARRAQGAAAGPSGRQQRQQQQRAAGKTLGKQGRADAAAGRKKEARDAASLAAAYGDAVVSEGRYKDAGLYVSHTREGKIHDESFDAETAAAELQSAVLDMGAEDREGMGDAQRRYHWDRRSKKYVLRGALDTLRKGKTVRNEAGKVVQIKDGERGELYRKWAKAHHKRIAASGDDEDAGAGSGRLAARFERKNRHVSFKQDGAPGGYAGGGGRGGRGGGRRHAVPGRARGGARAGAGGGRRGGGRQVEPLAAARAAGRAARGGGQGGRQGRAEAGRARLRCGAGGVGVRGGRAAPHAGALFRAL